MMNRMLPKYLLEKHQLTGTVTFAVLFSIVFLNLYIPFSDTAWFRLGNSVFFLFTAGFIAISIVFLIASRVIMYKTRHMFEMRVVQYALWCIAEVVVICLFYTFVTLDVVRPDDGPVPLRIFMKALLYASIALLVPYMMSAMYFIIGEKEKTIRLMNCGAGAESQDTAQADDMCRGSLVSLFDNNGALKLSIRSFYLYYMEADDNYIKVWYDDGRGALKMYLLRCRLKTVEESFKGTPLVRCNRKYIVNLDKVKVLRKESDGYFLDLDNDGIVPISVTRTYTENVLKHFPSGVAIVEDPASAVRKAETGT